MKVGLFPSTLTGDELFVFVIDRDLRAVLMADTLLTWCGLGLLALGLLVCLRGLRRGGWRRFEIDQARFGLGNQTITLRPNSADRQIAYKLWVELSTRKIGLPVNLNDDVISEVYDSWYDFFAVTRELVKDIPSSKLRRNDTQQIIRLSIDVLNTGLRPHLTKWQARFRCWYEGAIMRDDGQRRSPQEVQREFPEYQALKEELEALNEGLIRYRDKMYELATSGLSWQ